MTDTENPIYDEAWTEGRDLWVRGNISRSFIGTFSENGATLTAGARVFTKGSTMTYSLNGTWVSSLQKYIFSGGNFELYYNDIPYKKGTYLTGNNNMTMTVTHLGRYGLSSYTTYLDSSKDWYTKDELKTAAPSSYGTSIDTLYANAASTVIYALSDTLFLGGITYTKE